MSGFETETCTRCGGSGEYSYCQMYGKTCFKCGGSGKQFTKRGAAANAYLRAKRMRPASEVALGKWLRMDGVPGFSKSQNFKVDTIYTRLNASKSLQPDGTWKVYNHLVFEGNDKRGERCGIHTFPDAEIRILPTKEEAAQQIADAVAYQATLTKDGKVSKRLAAQD